jgi:hypothetical protein
MMHESTQLVRTRTAMSLYQEIVLCFVITVVVPFSGAQFPPPPKTAPLGVEVGASKMNKAKLLM